SHPRLRDRRPLPCSDRLLQRGEHALNSKAVGEIRMELEIARQALEEFRERCDERMLVADDVTRPPEIAEDGVLHLRDEHIARPLLQRGLGGIEELEVIQAL